MELVVVHQVAEPLHGAMHLLWHRFVSMLRLLAAWDEARYHRAECPDTERGLQQGLSSSSSAMRDRAFGSGRSRRRRCRTTPDWARSSHVRARRWRWPP